MESHHTNEHKYVDDYEMVCRRDSATPERPRSNSKEVSKTLSTPNEPLSKMNGKLRTIFALLGVFFVVTLTVFGVQFHWISRLNIQNNEQRELLVDEMRTLERNLINSVAELKNLSRNATKTSERNLIGMMEGSRTCSELRDSNGVSETGHYWTRNPFSGNGRYIYCNFQVYPDIATCSELSSKYNESEYGYYLLGGATGGFQYCPDVHTCHHLALRDGIMESGIYQVGPPGDQYDVYCNMSGGPAVTEIWHDSMNEIKATDCEDPDCYSHIPKYSISADKILKIINGSKQCRQYIKFRCIGAMLNSERSGVRYGSWSSRNGELMTYWGGVPSQRPGFCACGERGSCFDKNQRCNCDNNGLTMTQDEGYLTDKSKLPVSRMGFGDMGHSTESGWHTLGKLECSGAA